MAKIFVKPRAIVVPGEVIAEGEEEDIIVLSPLLERQNNKIYALIVGLIDIREDGDKIKLSIIPLVGAYLPKPGDLVIGLVEDVGLTHWVIDIMSPYKAILPLQEVVDRPINSAIVNIKKYLDVGDYILAKITAFDRLRDPIVTIKQEGLGRLVDGTIIEVQPTRIPRIIGKGQSMINMIREETKCRIIAARNGRIFVNCPSRELEEIVFLAIRKIEAEAHTTGLTDRIKEFIREEKKRRGVEEDG